MDNRKNRILELAIQKKRDLNNRTRMRNKIKETDFDFDYTGSNFSEKEIIEKGYPQLTGKELLLIITNKTIFGDYIMGYKFVTDIYKNRTTEGLNNVGTIDFGHWVIDMKLNTMSIKWDNGWFNTVTRAYAVNGTIEFYDFDTGNWRTTFKTFEEWSD